MPAEIASLFPVSSDIVRISGFFERDCITGNAVSIWAKIGVNKTKLPDKKMEINLIYFDSMGDIYKFDWPKW